MKSKLSVFLLLIIEFISAQNHRFIYQLKYKADSLSENYRTENMLLEINDNNVQFFEFRAIQMDSINKTTNSNSYYTFPIAKLKRQLSSDKNRNYYLINNYYYVFETLDKIDWKIESETKMKENWRIQKATAQFGGRSWEAWFTTEIPFSEGPYKFRGLPGLILEISDTKKQFIFDLAKIEKPKAVNPNIVESLFNKKPILINFEKYKEVVMEYYNDPFVEFRSMKPGSWSMELENNSVINKLEDLMPLVKEEQDLIRKENNPIELDKALIFK